jgi:hypothetical protein
MWLTACYCSPDPKQTLSHTQASFSGGLRLKLYKYNVTRQQDLKVRELPWYGAHIGWSSMNEQWLTLPGQHVTEPQPRCQNCVGIV